MQVWVRIALEAAWHVINPHVAAVHTGRGNVVPQSLHGGPGRAAEGKSSVVRASNFYHPRAAIQTSPAVAAIAKALEWPDCPRLTCKVLERPLRRYR